MPLLGKSRKNPADIVKILKDSLTTLEQSNDKKKTEKVRLYSDSYVSEDS